MSLLMKSIDCLVMQGEKFKDLPGFEKLISQRAHLEKCLMELFSDCLDVRG
jgi:hypothetical protein